MKTERGVSLIELLVVISIISILAGIGYPNLIKWKYIYKLKNFVYGLSSEIGYARDYSRKNGVRVIVAIVNNTSPQNWTGNSSIDPVLYIIFADKNRNKKYDRNNDTLLSFGKSNDIEVKEISRNLGKKCFSRKGKCITFYPVGPPSIGAVPGHVEFGSKRYSDVSYELTFRSITGITEVKRR